MNGNSDIAPIVSSRTPRSKPWKVDQPLGLERFNPLEDSIRKVLTQIAGARLPVMETTTTAICLPSLSYTLEEGVPVRPVPSERRDLVAWESQQWQIQSANASFAEMVASMAASGLVIETAHGSPQQATAGAKAPRQRNRILEIHGLMGAIGEQLMLAWAAEQDVQRTRANPSGRPELITTMLGRAQAEQSAHFILGASHSMGNLVLRLLLLDEDCGKAFVQKQPDFPKLDEALFAPGSAAPHGWLTLNQKLVARLQLAAAQSTSRAIPELVDQLRAYLTSPEFQALDGRRGLDYHRRRPQSVEHTAPREGTAGSGNGHEWVSLVASQAEPEAALEPIHDAVANGLEGLAQAMYQVRRLVPDVIRGAGIPYSLDFVERPDFNSNGQ